MLASKLQSRRAGECTVAAASEPAFKMASSTATGARSLLILHFNDVCTYASSFAMCTHAHTGPTQKLRADNVNSRTREPVGGAARMFTAMKQFKDENPVVLFSGDCVSPSTSEGDHSCGCSLPCAHSCLPVVCCHAASLLTKGQHMAPVMNLLGIDAACLGNHGRPYVCGPRLCTQRHMQHLVQISTLGFRTSRRFARLVTFHGCAAMPPTGPAESPLVAVASST